MKRHCAPILDNLIDCCLALLCEQDYHSIDPGYTSHVTVQKLPIICLIAAHAYQYSSLPSLHFLHSTTSKQSSRPSRSLQVLHLLPPHHVLTARKAHLRPRCNLLSIQPHRPQTRPSRAIQIPHSPPRRPPPLPNPPIPPVVQPSFPRLHRPGNLHPLDRPPPHRPRFLAHRVPQRALRHRRLRHLL